MKRVAGFAFVCVYAASVLVSSDPARWDGEHFSFIERLMLAGALGLAAGLLIHVAGRIDNKLLGISFFVLSVHALILFSTDPARWDSNHFLLGQRIGLSGILCLGAGLLIITGGIDLSMGSVAGFSATLFAVLMLEHHFPIPLAFAFVITTGVGIGLLHGVLVTRVGVQAFVVTLCGLFAYRGLARWLTNDDIPRIRDHVADLHEFFSGARAGLSVYLWILLAVFAIAAFFLHFTIHGRYLYAIGSNERAARYSGIGVDAYRVLAYVLCSLGAAVYGVTYAVHYNTAQPNSTGVGMELFAIAGAVLGGCSLRGGEGTILGMLIGAAILVLLNNLINMIGVKDTLEPVVIGVALLLCTVLDELIRRGITWYDAARIAFELATLRNILRVLTVLTVTLTNSLILGASNLSDLAPHLRTGTPLGFLVLASVLLLAIGFILTRRDGSWRTKMQRVLGLLAEMILLLLIGALALGASMILTRRLLD